MSLYDSSAIRRLGSYSIGIYKELQFDNASIIFHDDDNLHDVEKVFENRPRGILLLNKAVVYSPAHSQQPKMFSSSLAIHSGLPDYVDESECLKLTMFRQFCA